MKYDYIIVGAGLAGGVLARKLAEDNKRILIVERREHIAGNMYDYTDGIGVRVQMYGPHVFHTNNKEIYEFFSSFCETIPYKTRCEAVVDKISTPSPFNFKTIDQFYPQKDAEELKQLLLQYYNNRTQVTVVEMLESTEQKIRQYANFLFEKDYKLYTAKQWNLDPSEIDPSVLKRVPILLSYNDTYFSDEYEVMPKEGFTEFFRSLIEHSNIEVSLGIDALAHISIDNDKGVVLYDEEETGIIYTGAIDELFNYKFGCLPYRSLSFEFKSINVPSYQNSAIVAYPQEEGYTRITEYTKMPIQNANGCTTIAVEYPIAFDKNAEKGFEPYYPVLTEDSQKTYCTYVEYASNYRNLILCGRLADFKYYNMDQVILRAFEVYEKLEGRK